MKIRLVTAILALLAACLAARAEGDPAKGRKVYNKCIICHAVGPDARTKTGVHLNGVVGRPVAAVEGFDYSPALVAFAAEGRVWDEATLAAFLADPEAVVPKGKMQFAGLKRAAEIEHLLAYLRAIGPDGTGP